MHSLTPVVSPANEAFELRVLGPDAHPKGPCITARCGETVVGTASYHRADTELRVTDVDVTPDCGCRREDIVCALLDALELACLAGGCDRVVLRTSHTVSRALLQRRGYVVTNGCEGRWAEKSYRRA